MPVKSVFDVTQKWALDRGLDVSAREETGSTNDDAKQEAFNLGEEPKLYIAAHQTHGRGRGKNVWLDTGAGESLLSSWSFRLERPPQAITGPRVGEALFRSAEAIWPGFELSLKAPNDLFLGADKLAGLLVETISQGNSHRLIIGLGMNMLNHPRAIPTATHFIAQAGDQELSEDEWYQFLDVLKSQFTLATEELTLPSLTLEVRETLLRALNTYPKRSEDFIEITPTGDLVTASVAIPWSTQ